MDAMDHATQSIELWRCHFSPTVLSHPRTGRPHAVPADLFVNYGRVWRRYIWLVDAGRGEIMTRKIIRGLMVALALIIVAMGAWRWNLARKPTQELFADYGKVASFALTDQDGKPFGTAELAGKIWVADFVFTRCLGPCPLLTTRMAEIQKKFADKKNLMLVSFSVDPAYDQPAILTEYATRYGADSSKWKFLTGSADTIYPFIRNNFKLAVAPNNQDVAAGEIDIMHSLYFALVDKEGHIRGFYDTTDAAMFDKLKSDIPLL